MTSILGISAFYHDSAAALVIDGKIIAAAQEERFSRKKHDPRYPFNAVENKIYNGEELEVKIEKSENVFEKPIDNEIEDENILRRQNLKKYNYVFKNKNSSTRIWCSKRYFCFKQRGFF